MTATKNKLNDIISDNDVGISQKADMIEDGINDLDNAMKTKKGLSVAVHRLDSEITNTQIANKYLEIEHHINHYTNMSESDRKKALNMSACATSRQRPTPHRRMAI